MTSCHPARSVPVRRRLRLRRLGLLAACLTMLPGTSIASGGCTLGAGQSVSLQSDAVDPDVFVWDSRARLVAYAAGGWDSTREVMDHTLLASPGTTALVVSCAAGAAHPKYAAAAVDALGIKLVRGQNRGRFGWVIATDARPVAVAGGSRATRP